MAVIEKQAINDVFVKLQKTKAEAFQAGEQKSNIVQNAVKYHRADITTARTAERI